MIVSEIPHETETVLDASCLVAAISPREVHHSRARALYDSAPEALPFLVPASFRIEVLSALARRGEGSELLDIVDALVSGPRFHPVALESSLLERAAHVARAARLRAYDAVYAALALERGAALVTLDTEVCMKMGAAFPDAVLVTPG